ncbi:MAG: efflux RND transporter permease subunit [Methyloligellaceae bacterium]
MNRIIQLSIERPMAVVALVLMIILFGWIALQRIPIQMAPDVRQPVIIVKTDWRGAAPAEVEREIVTRQEDQLKGLEGLKKMTAVAEHNEGEITLEFLPGIEFTRALLLVANRLDRVTGYPEEVDEPRLSTSGTEDNAIVWYVITRDEGNNTPIIQFGDFLRDVMQERIERVDGVAGVNIFGDTERELRVIVDPVKLAKFKMTVSEVVGRIRSANASITGGDISEGKRRYVVRTEGDLQTVEQVRDIVLRSDRQNRGIGRVLISDIAEVELAFKEERARIRQLGIRAMAFNVTREQGANVLTTVRGIKKAVAELQAGPLKQQGLKLENVYDETAYIDSAIQLVVQNIYYGGILAVVILLVFLRSWRPTVIIATAIPVSVVGSFVAMALLGRSLNVISLAGIAFAVGMVVDAAIVVLENIFRLRQQGYSRAKAAYEGASQVWPAVLVSSLTTIFVFIPILIMDLEVGQLFRDIAVAISVSVLLSLLVSVTLIPALSNRLLGGNIDRQDANFRIPVIDHFGQAFSNFWQGFARLVVRSKVLALLTVAVITTGAATFTYYYLPKLDYLPIGNRNFVIGFVQPPEGYNLDTMESIGLKVGDATRKYWQIEAPPGEENSEERKIKRFFFVALRGRAFMGAAHVDDSKAEELIPLLQDPARQEPGVFAFLFQPSLFGRSIGSGRAIEVDISGPDLETIFGAGRQVFFRLIGSLPPHEGHRTRPRPSLSLGEPEVRVLPDRVRLNDNGLSARQLGQSIDAFNDGLRVAEISVDGRRIDLTLMGPKSETEATQSISMLPIVTRDGRIIPVQSVSDVLVTNGPSEIRRRDRVRTVTMQVTPEKSMPLEEAIDIIRTKVIEPLQAQGLPDGVTIRISGAADKLAETWNEMIFDLLLAVVIVYLIMAVLFESFIYPLIVLLSVPVAAAGGLLGLVVLNMYTVQALDMLTMLGFVILIGIVVNNSILLVHQTLHHIRVDNMEADAAIERATQNRIRPIFMSTLTSVFGMLPLVVFPGAGAELYRGLGSVVLGGLSLSAILTMAIVPPMMSITVSWMEKPRAANETLASQA